MIAAKNISGFRGCFMRDELKALGKPKKYECGILNYNTSDQDGSHWTAWRKKNNAKEFFDPFGMDQPPREVVDYLGGENLKYNDNRYQDYDDGPICGYLCLAFLKGKLNFKDLWI